VGWLKKIGERFSSPDLKLARALADQAGAQIENVLLYQETLTQTKLKNEMELASRIQLGLMPRREPVAPGIQVYGNARPALRVGGDFFDYILRSNVSLFFSVGDVAGKGMSAALLMSVVQTTTRNVERFMPVPTPAKILYRVSDDLYNELSELGTFVTQFICQYDSSQRTCTFANAGHSPVVYRPAEAEARLLVADGTAMGVLPQDAWVDHVLPIHPGDVLIAATDGFVEAHNAQEEMFGYDNLLRLVNQVASRSASEIGVALYDAVDRFAATHPQDDDQTVIVIKGI
jgi:sigma-B regulation protein RsbU (phosphoserine phosphatase)